MADHTPGPWTTEGMGMKVYARAEQMHICDIRGWGHLTGRGGGLALSEECAIEIQKANARLITAAPDLLAACQAFVTAYKKSLQLEKTEVALRLADAAIAKAEGR